MTALSFDLRLLLASPAFEGASFLFGLVVGSFANVCVHRLPRGQSVVHPPSRCPSCGSRIAPRDNVPVLGWLWLRGRCRSCHAPISPRYPAVELLNGFLYLALAVLFGPARGTLAKMALATALVVLALVDLDHQILPDMITLPFLLLGLAMGVLLAKAPAPQKHLAAAGGFTAMALAGMVFGWDRRRDPAATGPDVKMVALLLAFLAPQLWLGMPLEPGAAAVSGYLLMGGLAAVAARYYGQEALGQGDWKMVAMLGAFFGFQGGLLAVLLGTLAGAVFGLTLIAIGRGSRRMKVPLGTFLALGGLTVLFAGKPLLDWYRGLYRG